VLDPAFLRPAEVDHSDRRSAKAREQLQWKPTVDFKGLVTMMVDAAHELDGGRPDTGYERGQTSSERV
jgi:GDPmannose 4,6-dehydratase